MSSIEILLENFGGEGGQGRKGGRGVEGEGKMGIYIF